MVHQFTALNRAYINYKVKSYINDKLLLILIFDSRDSRESGIFCSLLSGLFSECGLSCRDDVIRGLRLWVLVFIVTHKIACKQEGNILKLKKVLLIIHITLSYIYLSGQISMKINLKLIDLLNFNLKKRQLFDFLQTFGLTFT